jgi:class 3 adenylate cyclase/tetratricopeptide (TPR) repeat protein
MSAPRKERKVVTVLFADLVGFTARAETLDPEDVEAILRPYHERLRYELERFGGTVEKFIGDAVMALFGAPVAHEDDPERAVRAALAIRDWARESGDVQVRLAVNTGEALVNLGARTELGEGMAAGDVVNTTARLQTAAPVNGVLAGESTYRATRHVIEYSDAAAVDAKGKTVPIPVWEADAPRARVGSEAVSRRAPLVGRERERDQLVDAFERTRQESSAQFVTLVGVPGIGKSRLVAELLDYAEALPELVYWRHGRSLPYGEGVTFWALAEMVKAQAGIVENDTPAEAERKLRETVAEVVAEAEQPWVEASLRPLLGLGDSSDAVGGERDRVPAWRKFLESLAEQHPLVLVFEDLHWADDELLDFVDELPDWSEDVPMLVLATARPELLTRRPGWGGGKRNALTISLSALAAEDTARLLAALLERAVLPAETQSALLDRAGGNPLYAEQFVRMLSERGELGGEVPENVQAIIAARLDALPEDEKAVLQDAAVVGKVFWTGSLAAVNGGDPTAIEQQLRSLTRKDFVRRERRASVEGESEYSFNHILVQDVAYGQIPRSARAEKHTRTGEWIESLGRASDQAELLAHHYGRALELLRAAGAEPGGLAARARSALRAAGTRALSLTAYAAAVRSFEAADAIDAQPDPDRPRALLHHGLALHALLDPGRFDLLDEAREALVAAGDGDGAAEATVALAEAWWWAGDNARCVEFLDQAAGLVRDGSDLSRALVLSQIARFKTLFGDNPGSVETALESLRLAESLGRDDLRGKNLITLGTARAYLPGADLAAAADEIRGGMEIAKAGGYFDQLSRGMINLGSNRFLAGDLDAAHACVAEAHELAQLRGHRAGLRFCEGSFIDIDLTRGDWRGAERRADAFLQESEQGAHLLDPIALDAKATVCLARDETVPAVEYVDRAVASARKVRDPQAVVPALGTAALIYAELELPEPAREFLAEIEPGAHIAAVPAPAFAAVRLGVAEEWRRRAASGRRSTRWDEAADAVVDERWQDAASLYDEIGARPYAALAALRAAGACVAAGDRPTADRLLAQALAFYRSVGATRYVREGERLLAATA